ncbi:MAG: CbiX/SirB N-terminal domain-containing protein [Verrucomicrobiota bacterium]|nr:CbiX/SirB N-terminal domain-containing protein [Verrucomicrobiota bacterium]
MDNGTLRPDSILNLRKVAKNLSTLVQVEVFPIGLMHSHKVDPGLIGGEPALSVESLTSSEFSEESTELIFIPFFFGPSLGIREWLPKKLNSWIGEHPNVSFRILGELFRSGDDRIARALADHSRKTIRESKMCHPSLALVDHGTPLREVNQVREQVGDELEKLMSSEISDFSTCSMERREGKEYDFNDPLLESILEKWSENKDKDIQILVAPLFLLPGRHAGEEGDLAKICSRFHCAEKNILIERSDLLGQHPLVLEVLRDRIKECKPFS